MKCLLVAPKYPVQANEVCCYPLGFMHVSARLKALGHDVKVLNFNLFDYDMEKEIKGRDVLLVTGFEGFFEEALKLAALAKKEGVRSVVGGILGTFATQEMTKHFDTVVVGEADELDSFCDGVMRLPTPDIDKAAWPDYEGFGVEEYHRRHGAAKFMGILTSRGCPYRCTFCAQTASYRVRKLADVINEIDSYMARYGIRNIVFNDNSLNIDRGRWFDLCAAMKERRLLWGASLRADLLDEEMVARAVESGIQGCIIGVESLDQSKLNRLNKKLRVSDVFAAMTVLEKHNVDWYGNILVGFEWESLDDIMSEVASIPKDFAHRLFPTLVHPFAGTRNGTTRRFTAEQENALERTFAAHAKAMGKHQLPVK